MRSFAIVLVLIALASLAPTVAADKVDKVETVAYKVFQIKPWIVYDGPVPTEVYVYNDKDLDGQKDASEAYIIEPVYLPP